MPEHQTVAIVGVGLIGGSIGKALRERKLADKVIGIGRREETLKKAKAAGAVDHTTTDLKEGISEADLIVLATPVQTIVRTMDEVASACRKSAWVTDAGSTKEHIVQSAEKAFRDAGPYFVGSHPLAGDHRTGPEHARADLFEGRTVVVTPTDKSDQKAISRITDFWQSLGAKVETMTPAEHDQRIAVVSHLPHLVAAALASATPEKLLPLAASGWRDTTRIASGDPQLWQEIFATNRASALEALETFEHKLAELKAALGNSDDARLKANLEGAKRIRDALGN
jgi:prephenate dehydrogenase